MTKLTKNEFEVLSRLREKAESDDGDGWWTVYLDNAFIKGWNKKRWSSVLGSLKKKGLYREIDDPDFRGIFGQVKGARPGH